MHYSCCTSQLGSDTCKCESHRNVRAMYLLVFFSLCCIFWPCRGDKEKRVLGRKRNRNNESVAPKKREITPEDAKEDKQLDLFFRSFYAYNNRSEISTVEPSVSNHPKCKDLVIAYGRWSLPIKNQTTGGLFQEDVQANLCFVEDNLLHATSKLLHV